MSLDQSNRVAFFAVIITTLAYIAARLFGSDLFDNHWALVHWQFVDSWYLVLLAVLGSVVFYLLSRYPLLLESLLSTPSRVVLAGLVVMIGLFLLKFDSFVYTAGNERVQMISGGDDTVLRWYEFFSVGTVLLFNKLYNLFGLQGHSSSVLAWRTFVYMCAATATYGCICIVRDLSSAFSSRLNNFLVLLFGMPLLLLVGFIGTEPALLAGSVWFVWWALRVNRSRRLVNILAMWSLVVITVFSHAAAIYLIPTAVYVTLISISKTTRLRTLHLMLGVSVLAAIVAGVYYLASNTLELSHHLLFLNGKNPHASYGIFSGRHIGDLIQLLLFMTPSFLVAILALAFGGVRAGADNNHGQLVITLLLACSGLTALFVIEPVNGIVFDLPRLLVFTFPLTVVAVVAMTSIKNHQGSGLFGKWSTVAVAFCVLAPMSYLPAYTKLASAEPYLVDYLEQHPSFFRTAGYSFRDSYFYRKELDRANYWDQNLLAKSPDLINLSGSRNLIETNQASDALTVLYRMKVNHPYWLEPRMYIVEAHLMFGRFDQAKPEIDTCLMLRPFGKGQLSNLYRYYRERKEYAHAYRTIMEIIDIYPNDLALRSDEMIVHYRLGNRSAADSLAELLMIKSPESPFPYAIKGFLLESAGRIPEAIDYYEKFVEFGPDEPESPAVRQRLVQLKNKMSQRKK